MNIKMIKLNNVQYNSNRDQAVYRRPINTDFRLQAMLGGSGSATARFEVDGKSLCENTLSLPGNFDCEFRFDQAGSRVGQLVIEASSSTLREPVRIDVLEHEPIG